MKVKIDREKKLVVLIPDDPRAREGIKEEMPFSIWYKFADEVNTRIAKSHRA